MNREQMMDKVRQQMPKRRWEHTLGVMQSAVALAKQYGVDPAQAELAALLHDYTKFWPIERQAEIIREAALPAELLKYDPQLWHAPSGAWVVQQELNIHDEEVLDAIRYHTSGRENMTKLDKVICLADYIEPGRSFPGVEEIRALAKQSLEQALIAGFDSTISYLLASGKKVFPLTIQARNVLIEELKHNE